ncbi:MAG: hypothetical protein ACRCU0_00515 [Candidatus Rhabdochlamydia sp.]
MIFCYKFSEEIDNIKDEICKDLYAGRAFFCHRSTCISFSALVQIDPDGKSMFFENVHFHDYCNGFGWPQEERFFRSLLEIRCFIALEIHLSQDKISENLINLHKKLTSSNIFHAPYHFWDHLEIKDLDYLKKQLQLIEIKNTQI